MLHHNMCVPPMSTLIKRHYILPFPALNAHRRNKSVATDTIYSDTPVVASGATQAQFYLGQQSLVCDVFEMIIDKKMIINQKILSDNVVPWLSY